MQDKPAINTNVRLFDLVRYMRAELHEENLISDEEYAWLCAEASMANSPKGGSPSPRRLEDYDGIKQELEATKRKLKAVEGRDAETLQACQHWIAEFNRVAKYARNTTSKTQATWGELESAFIAGANWQEGQSDMVTRND